MAGIFDPALDHLNRAPVDQLFAGKNSALIDDDEWVKAVENARLFLGKARGGSSDHREGSAGDQKVRGKVQEETGLFVYPGQGIKTDPKDVTFMTEFDDSGASLIEGWRDAEEMPKTLGGLLQHEELYKHYPELASMPIIEEEDPEALGSYGGVTEDNPLGVMGVQTGVDDAEVLRTLLHESQHYIQDLEGWPRGGAFGHSALKNFAEHHPERFNSYDQAYRNSESDYEADYWADEADWESYANISGEILARDVEQRFDKRNELNAAADTLLNPNNPDYYPGRTEGNKENLLYRLFKQSQEMDNTYPYIKRTTDNSYPHDMPGYEVLTPLLTSAAMGQRKGDKYADESKKYAESLLDEILKGMKK